MSSQSKSIGLKNCPDAKIVANLTDGDELPKPPKLPTKIKLQSLEGLSSLLSPFLSS